MAMRKYCHCLGVMPGLDPGIPIHMARLEHNRRDCRDEPGNDD
jgi:hypothetical protein